MKVTACILARDEELTIGPVIERVKGLVDEVLVVDGHSIDQTVQVAEEHGARVVQDGGCGKGDGYKTGIRDACGDVIVFLDADGSHEPQDVPKLAAPILEGRLDLVIASRWRGGSDDMHPNLTHLIRDLGGNILSIIISYRFGREITDCLNGFRAIRREVAQALDLKADDFDIEHEMVIKALKRGFRVGEVPSHEYARAGGRSKLPTFRKAPLFFLRLFQEIF
jgi:glycosyltransferase involved in cell wall biosynthesis